MRVMFYTVFLSFIVGCGVMYSPNDKNSEAEKEDQKGSIYNEIAKGEITPLFKIATFKSRDLDNSLQEYRVFSDKSNLLDFLEDFDMDDTLFKDLNISQKRVLYYPFKAQDCNLSQNIELNQTKAFVKLTPIDGSCKEEDIFYQLFYLIDNSITDVVIYPFELQSIEIDL
jgi:DNA polymerase elongation subunit (family B)